MNKIISYIFLFFTLSVIKPSAQLPPVFEGTHLHDVQIDETVRRFAGGIVVLMGIDAGW